MASLSIFHLGVLSWMAILLNIDICYGIALLAQLINITRLIEMWMFVRVCVSSSADTGGLSGLKTPKAMEGVLDPPVCVTNITVKDSVYRPTSELVSM